MAQLGKYSELNNQYSVVHYTLRFSIKGILVTIWNLVLKLRYNIIYSSECVRDVF